MDRLHEELKEPIFTSDNEDEEDEEDEAMETRQQQQTERPRRARSHDSLCQSDDAGEQGIPDNDEVASQTSDGGDHRGLNKNRRLRKRSPPEVGRQLGDSTEGTVVQGERRSMSKYEQDLQNSEKDIDETETAEDGQRDAEESAASSPQQPERRTRKTSHSKMSRSPSHEDVTSRTAGESWFLLLQLQRFIVKHCTIWNSCVARGSTPAP